jgi:hypothetical protein
LSFLLLFYYVQDFVPHASSSPPIISGPAPDVCCPVHFISAQASAPADCSDSSHRSNVPWSFRLAFVVRSVFSADQARRLLFFLCSFSLVRSCPVILARELCSTQLSSCLRSVLVPSFCSCCRSARTETSRPGRKSKRSARSGFACSSVTSVRYLSCWCVALRVNSFLDRVLAST